VAQRDGAAEGTLIARPQSPWPDGAA
jgi:hypothetical protein